MGIERVLFITIKLGAIRSHGYILSDSASAVSAASMFIAWIVRSAVNRTRRPTAVWNV